MTIFKFNNNKVIIVPCHISSTPESSLKKEDGTVITEPFPESVIISDILKKE